MASFASKKFRNEFLLALVAGTQALAQTPALPEKEKAPTVKKAEKPALPLKGDRKVEFTTDEGTWLSVDVAPGGKMLVFDLLGDLYTLPIEGGEAKRITSGLAFDSQPRFSPDGKWITYISDREGSENIWVVRPDGTDPKQVSKDPNHEFVSPSWSPDGSYIYVSKSQFGLGSREIWMYHLAGGTGLQVTKSKPAPTIQRKEELNALGAVASSDGEHVYYALRKGAFSYNVQFPLWKIVRRNRRTGVEDEFIASAAGAFRPTLSPDGKRMVYFTRHENETGMRTRDLVTGEDKWVRYPVTRDEQESMASRDLFPGLAFLPGSKEVVYHQNGKLRRLDLDSGQERIIPFIAKVSQEIGPKLDFPQQVEAGPVRSRLIMSPDEAPNGKALAFSALGKLYVMELPGGTPRLLVPGKGNEFQPIWSPDGTSLAYVTWSNEGGELWKIPAKGGSPTRLSKSRAYYSNPMWSQDGSRIALLRGNAYDRTNNPIEEGPGPNTDVIWIPAAGGEAHLILPSRGSGGPHRGPDKERVYVNTPEGLASYRWDGSDRRMHLIVKGQGAFYDKEPVAADDLVLSPDGNWVLAQVMNQLYLLPVPLPGGEVPTINVTAPSVPVKRLTDIGADYFAWVDGGRSVAWALGSSWFHQALADISLETPKEGVEGKKADEESKPKPFKERDPKVTEFKVNVEVPRKTPKGTVVFRGVRAVTMKGDEILEGADIVIENNRITRVGPRGDVPPGAKVMDLSGKTVIPGFIDTHAHWMEIRRGVLDLQNWSFLANLAFGVTAGLDVQTNTNDMFAYQDLVDAGEIIGPRAFSTGPGVFSNNAFQSMEEAKGVLTKYRDYYGTRNIKSYIVGNRKQRQFMVQAAKELGMMPTTEGGLDLKLNLTHALDGFHGNEHTLPVAPLFKDVLQLFAQSGIAETPTLIVQYGGPWGEVYWYEKSDIHHDPKVNRFIPHAQIDQRTQRQAAWFRDDQYSFPKFAAQMTKLVRSGGLVGVGSHGEFQGLGYHWELWMLASGGMTPHEVLRCATSNGAKIIGRPEELGSIEVGKLADLIIFDKNPLEDIQNTRTIHWVMKNGELFEGNTLDQVWPETKSLGPLWFWNSYGEPKKGEDLDYGVSYKLPPTGK